MNPLSLMNQMFHYFRFDQMFPNYHFDQMFHLSQMNHLVQEHRPHLFANPYKGRLTQMLLLH
jgi:hypothetical protein